MSATPPDGRRSVMHADMDAFYAAVEQRDRPELRGKPVIVGGRGGRGVVSTASYEARVFGVHSAMPGMQARKLCPHGVFLAGDMKKYARESRRIFEIFRRFTPAVEGISLDEAFLDLTGTERLWGPPARVAEALRAAVRDETGLAVSVGIAPVKMVAKIASDLAKPDGWLEVAPEQVRDFLDPLPVGRIWGVGPVARARLERVGIVTIGDLARAPDERLARLLGSWGPAVARLARGRDRREVEAYREARSYSEENTFADDVSDPARLRDAIRAHAEAVARRLRNDGLRARTLTLKLKLSRGLGGGRYPLVTRSGALRPPSDDGAEFAALGRCLLARAALDGPVRLVGVAATKLEPRERDQLDLFESEAPERQRRSALNSAVDRIRDRFGDDVLQRGRGTPERAGLSHQIKRGERDAGSDG